MTADRHVGTDTCAASNGRKKKDADTVALRSQAQYPGTPEHGEGGQQEQKRRQQTEGGRNVWGEGAAIDP